MFSQIHKNRLLHPSKKFKTLFNLQDKIESCSVKFTKIVVFNLYYAFQFGAFLARQLSQLFFFYIASMTSS